jgi:hypothetical protein
MATSYAPPLRQTIDVIRHMGAACQDTMLAWVFLKSGHALKWKGRCNTQCCLEGPTAPRPVRLSMPCCRKAGAACGAARKLPDTAAPPTRSRWSTRCSHSRCRPRTQHRRPAARGPTSQCHSGGQHSVIRQFTPCTPESHSAGQRGFHSQADGGTHPPNAWQTGACGLG